MACLGLPVLTNWDCHTTVSDSDSFWPHNNPFGWSLDGTQTSRSPNLSRIVMMSSSVKEGTHKGSSIRNLTLKASKAVPLFMCSLYSSPFRTMFVKSFVSVVAYQACVMMIMFIVSRERRKMDRWTFLACLGMLGYHGTGKETQKKKAQISQLKRYLYRFCNVCSWKFYAQSYYRMK